MQRHRTGIFFPISPNNVHNFSGACRRFTIYLFTSTIFSGACRRRLAVCISTVGGMADLDDIMRGMVEALEEKTSSGASMSSDDEINVITL
jgi:hypothetical protein